GTEVADWLNSLGVAAVVVKYRVPTGNQPVRWLAPVQDAQRAISLTRQHASDWGVKSDHVAVLGFSAGGETAGRTAVAVDRKYEAIDKADEFSCRPDAAALIYPAGMLNADRTGLADDVVVDDGTPPMFIVHAFDDRVPPECSLQMMLALKKAGVASELHLYNTGGHGYGLRPVDNVPVTTWADRCAAWLRQMDWVQQ
ncbi:MAG: alpha/beta hydrolase, partial [Planctomycetaceae bacterium]|nr:alpha/beta hydrolase [Planctomycetaceae bacterium]